MDMPNKFGQHIRIGIGVDPVTKVEDVPWVAVIIGEYPIGTRESGRYARQNERRVQVALHDDIVAKPRTSRGDRRSPVQSHHRGARITHGRQQMVAANSEVN